MDRRRFIGLSAAVAAAPLATACSGAEKIAAPGVPRGPFDEDSTAEEVTDGIDLSGKIAVVTGCTSGIGFETMRVLALRGAWVIGTRRSLQRADDACRRTHCTVGSNSAAGRTSNSVLVSTHGRGTAACTSATSRPCRYWSRSAASGRRIGSPDRREICTKRTGRVPTGSTVRRSTAASDR